MVYVSIIFLDSIYFDHKVLCVLSISNYISYSILNSCTIVLSIINDTLIWIQLHFIHIYSTKEIELPTFTTLFWYILCTPGTVCTICTKMINNLNYVPITVSVVSWFPMYFYKVVNIFHENHLSKFKSIDLYSNTLVFYINQFINSTNHLFVIVISVIAVVIIIIVLVVFFSSFSLCPLFLLFLLSSFSFPLFFFENEK